jgi:hypothetical protein
MQIASKIKNVGLTLAVMAATATSAFADEVDVLASGSAYLVPKLNGGVAFAITAGLALSAVAFAFKTMRSTRNVAGGSLRG